MVVDMAWASVFTGIFNQATWELCNNFFLLSATVSILCSLNTRPGIGDVLLLSSSICCCRGNLYTRQLYNCLVFSVTDRARQKKQLLAVCDNLRGKASAYQANFLKKLPLDALILILFF